MWRTFRSIRVFFDSSAVPMNVSEAIADVDRNQYLPPECRDKDLANVAVKFNEGQTVPTAAITRFMIELAKIDENSIVLEIGTGSGYQAAILGRIARQVHTIEIRDNLPGLANKLPTNVYMYHYDGTMVVPPGQFDAIIVTCAVPGAYVQWQIALKEGGRLVMPKANGEVCRYTKHNYVLEDEGVFAYASFVDVKTRYPMAGLINE